ERRCAHGDTRGLAGVRALPPATAACAQLVDVAEAPSLAARAARVLSGLSREFTTGGVAHFRQRSAAGGRAVRSFDCTGRMHHLSRWRVIQLVDRRALPSRRQRNAVELPALPS